MARTQTLVQLTDELVAALDRVAARDRKSRSELIREAITAYLAEVLATDVDRRIVEAYTRQPQTVDAWDFERARASIAEEPW